MMTVSENSPKKDSVSTNILSYAQRLADRADTLANRCAHVLSSVTNPAAPIQENVKTAEKQAYPPLFDELRERFNVIERSLSYIEDTLDRTEL